MLLEKEEVMDLDIILKDELDLFFSRKDEHFLKIKGLKLSNFDITIKDKNKFTQYVIGLLFKDYKIIDCQGGYEAGHPDFILKSKQDTIYLEIKLGGDTLTRFQLKWITKNKDKNKKVLWIVPDINYFEDNSDGKL